MANLVLSTLSFSSPTPGHFAGNLRYCIILSENISESSLNRFAILLSYLNIKALSKYHLCSHFPNCVITF